VASSSGGVPGMPRIPSVPKNSLGHVKKPVSPKCDTGPLGPTSVWMTSAKLNIRKIGDYTVRSHLCRLHNWEKWKNQSNKSPNMLARNSGTRGPKWFARVCYVEPRSRSCPLRKRPPSLVRFTSSNFSTARDRGGHHSAVLLLRRGRGDHAAAFDFAGLLSGSGGGIPGKIRAASNTGARWPWC